VTDPEVVSREEWLAARKELLAHEKELTHQRGAVSQSVGKPARRASSVPRGSSWSGPDDRKVITVMGPSAPAARADAGGQPESTRGTCAKVRLRIRHRVPTHACSS
jgi:hypothetical protein